MSEFRQSSDDLPRNDEAEKIIEAARAILDLGESIGLPLRLPPFSIETPSFCVSSKSVKQRQKPKVKVNELDVHKAHKIRHYLEQVINDSEEDGVRAFRQAFSEFSIFLRNKFYGCQSADIEALMQVTERFAPFLTSEMRNKALEPFLEQGSLGFSIKLGKTLGADLDIVKNFFFQRLWRGNPEWVDGNLRTLRRYGVDVTQGLRDVTQGLCAKIRSASPPNSDDLELLWKIMDVEYDMVGDIVPDEIRKEALKSRISTQLEAVSDQLELVSNELKEDCIRIQAGVALKTIEDEPESAEISGLITAHVLDRLEKEDHNVATILIEIFWNKIDWTWFMEEIEQRYEVIIENQSQSIEGLMVEFIEALSSSDKAIWAEHIKKAWQKKREKEVGKPRGKTREQLLEEQSLEGLAFLMGSAIQSKVLEEKVASTPHLLSKSLKEVHDLLDFIRRNEDIIACDLAIGRSVLYCFQNGRPRLGTLIAFVSMFNGYDFPMKDILEVIISRPNLEPYHTCAKIACGSDETGLISICIEDTFSAFLLMVAENNDWIHTMTSEQARVLIQECSYSPEEIKSMYDERMNFEAMVENRKKETF